MGKKKTAQDNRNGAIPEASNIEDSNSINMGKKTKSRKNKDDFEDDREMELLAIDSGLEMKNNEVADAPAINEPLKGKKGKKNRRKGEEEDYDSLLAELEAEHAGNGKPKEKVSTEQPKPPPVKEEKNNEVADAPAIDEPLKGKKGKKNRRKGEEDHDSMLAELEAELAGDGKPKEKVSTGQPKPPAVKEEAPAQKEKETKLNKVTEPKKKQANGKGKINENANKKDTKNKKKEEVQPTKSKKGPSKKMLDCLKERMAKEKEDKDRQEREFLESQRREEERIRQLQEEKRLNEEKKEKARQKQKEKVKKLKEEGKFLTPKQKLEQQRANATLEMLKVNGHPLPGSIPAYEGSSNKRVRRRKQDDQSKETSPKPDEEVQKTPEPVGEVEAPVEVVEDEDDDVIDDWDDMDSEEDVPSTPEETSSRGAASPVEQEHCKAVNGLAVSVEQEPEVERESKRERLIRRLESRRLQNEANKDPNNLRSPVVCVLGHVDHGKTKILDKLKGTNVQEGEAGNITQEIRATIVSPEIIASQTRMVNNFDCSTIKFPGLLIIDTPGHESFSNLRNRGSSLCDFAILVVDINQGVQQTTVESINLLKAKRTPFLVALNKVDLIYEWKSNANIDIQKCLETQPSHTRNDFDRRVQQIIQELNMQGLNAALYWENPNPKTYVSLVPTSAIAGDGMGSLISQLCTLCQKRLCNRLQFSEELQCTVLEVSAIQGHGTTVYVVLVNGRLKEGDTIVVAGTDGPILTQIRSLHIPKARSRFQYNEHKEVKGTQGVMVAAKDLEKAFAGWSLSVVKDDVEADYIKEQVDDDFKRAMRSMKVKDKGAYVQASSIGALEALLTLFRTSKIPFSGIKVGPVVKKDVMKASAMLEHDPMYAIILAFNVKVDRDAQELADKEGVTIFCEPIIYHLADRFEEYIKNFRKKKQDECRSVAVFPCRLKILPDSIFNKRDPIVLGISVEAGLLRTGTPLIVPSKEFVEIGVVTSLEFDHKSVEIAKKGVEVCVKIEPLPGHTPKLFGRHFDQDDMLVSKITREGLDACKEHFRDDLSKADWKLMVELKKLFRII